jgi:hypothetical protein
MALIESGEALSLLGRHLPAFYRCVDGAWTDYMSYPIEKRIIHSERSRASLVHDHMVDRASQYAAREEGVEIMERSGLHLFVFGGTIAIRFKKFDEDLRTRNQPTEQVKRFKAQYSLIGVPDAHNLESGYILSPDGQSIKAIHLVCPSGTGIYWDVLLTESEQTSVVQDLFGKSLETEEENSGARVKRREEAKIIQLKKDDDKS